MSENLFILGAGASAEAGAPTMQNFIDRAEQLKGTANGHSEDFKRFFDILNSLKEVQSKSELDLDNLEWMQKEDMDFFRKLFLRRCQLSKRQL